MPTRLEWQTEDAAWDKQRPLRPPPGQTPPRRWRSWLLVSTLLLLLSLLTLLQLRRRADTAAATVRADVLGGLALVQRAAATRDGELFRTALSGRDPLWTGDQETLLAEGWLFGRDVLGLTWQADADLAPQAVDVHLSPDLQEATVDFTLIYAADSGSASLAEVALRQTQVYRRSNDGRWLLSPPTDEFWGGSGVLTTTYLTIDYPLRDAALVRRLAADLDQAVGVLCGGEEALPCAADTQLALTFDTQTQALLTMSAPELWARGKTALLVPTPSLVGIPENETGYSHLLSGYAYHLLPALVNQSLGLKDGPRSVLYQALVDEILLPTGLFRTPALSETAAALLLQPPGNYEQFWTSAADPLRRSTAWQEATLMARFLGTYLGRSGRPVAALQSLDLYVTLNRWLTVITGVDAPDLFEPWVRFLQREAGAQALPRAGKVGLVCTGSDLPDGAPAALVGFEPMTAHWSVETTLPAPSFAVPVPAAEAILFFVGNQGRFVNPRANELMLWQSGQLRAVSVPEDGLPSIDYAATGVAAGSVLPIVRFSAPSTDNDAAFNRRFSLLDLAACRSGACALETVAGAPRISPDGAHYLEVVDDTDTAPGARSLLLRARNGALLAELGSWSSFPFWIDARRFVTVGPEGEIGQGSIDAPQPVFLVRLKEIADALAWEPSIRNNYALAGAFSSRQRPDEVLLLILAFDPERRTQRGNYRLVAVNPETGSLEVLFSAVAARMTAQQSPTGRFIAFHNQDGDSDDVVDRLSVLDLSTVDAAPSIVTVNAVWRNYLSWSAADRSLLTAHGAFLRIFDLDTQENQLHFVPDSLSCSQAFWLNRE